MAMRTGTEEESETQTREEAVMRKGRTIYHCHGKKRGKKLRTYSSVAKAKAAHRAIQAKKRKK